MAISIRGDLYTWGFNVLPNGTDRGRPRENHYIWRPTKLKRGGLLGQDEETVPIPPRRDRTLPKKLPHPLSPIMSMMIIIIIAKNSIARYMVLKRLMVQVTSASSTAGTSTGSTNECGLYVSHKNCHSRSTAETFGSLFVLTGANFLLVVAVVVAT